MNENSRYVLSEVFLGIFLPLVIIAIFIRFFLFQYPLPWKNLDTSSRSYQISNFRIEDYNNREDLRRAFSALVSVGTKKDYVEKLLVNFAHVEIRKGRLHKEKQEQGYSLYYYTHSSLGNMLLEKVFFLPEGELEKKIGVYYDKEDRVTDFFITM